MNEAQTRAELIDPQLKQSGWGVAEDSKILREYYFTAGKIKTGGTRAKPLKADYVLVYKNQKLAVVEAKSDERPVGEGVAQAKNYAAKLNVPFAYAGNGNEIYEINMNTGAEKDVTTFPTPAELWQRIFKNRMIGATLLMLFLLKISAAANRCASIRKSPSTKRSGPLPTEKNASC